MNITIKLKELLKSEAFSGILLIVSFFCALLISNSTSSFEFYNSLVFTPITFKVGTLSLDTTLVSLVNDGLMTFFFLLLGLELKYHLVFGEYQDKAKLLLPMVSAIGGIVAPALIYAMFNFDQESLKGWAIPVASDTAFILGILTFFRQYISLELRVFILGFSLIDDAAALVILALFYTGSINFIALALSFVMVAILAILNYLKVQKNSLYLLTGAVLWVVMVEAGIHGTLCGAIIALAIPVKYDDKINQSFHSLEQSVQPWVYYLILPIFIFLNSGVNFDNFSLTSACSNISIGIIAGLFIGKQVGIFGFAYPFIKLGYAQLPARTSWLKFYAIAVLGGIGFTLSLFIGGITFESGCPAYAMRSSVIIGSGLSAALGILLLYYSTKTGS